jgi:hypothetical protein
MKNFYHLINFSMRYSWFLPAQCQTDIFHRGSSTDSHLMGVRKIDCFLDLSKVNSATNKDHRFSSKTDQNCLKNS